MTKQSDKTAIQAANVAASAEDKKAVVSTTKLNAGEKRVQKLALELLSTIAVQDNDAKSIVGKLTTAYVAIDTARAKAKGGTQLERSEIMSEINSLAGYNPAPSSGIAKEGQVKRNSRFDSLVRRVVETVIILRAPKSKRPSKLTLSKAGHLQRPHNLTVPHLGKTTSGKPIKNPENAPTDLTVKQVSALYGDIHPTKKRGTKKLQTTQKQIADSQKSDIDVILDRMLFVTDSIANKQASRDDIMSKEQVEKMLRVYQNLVKMGCDQMVFDKVNTRLKNRKAENLATLENAEILAPMKAAKKAEELKSLKKSMA